MKQSTKPLTTQSFGGGPNANLKDKKKTMFRKKDVTIC